MNDPATYGAGARVDGTERGDLRLDRDKDATSAATPNHRCPQCGYEMWVGPLKVTPGIEATFIAFCPVDGYEMRRMDALGELETEMDGEPKTFDQFVTEQPNVLGVIHAEVPDADE